MATAAEIANLLVRIGESHGDTMTNLRIQKLLYYCQGWHLALYGTTLFSERLEAWTHGPVQPEVYDIYKKNSFGVIKEAFSVKGLGVHIIRHVIEVFKVYSGFSAIQLEDMTHQELPWKNARKGLPGDAPSKYVISRYDLQNYFQSLLNEWKER